jgi:membrane protein YdbS with pleckstrin-like domain
MSTDLSPTLERLAPGALNLFRLQLLVRAGLYGFFAASLGLGFFLAGRGLWVWLVVGAILALLLFLLVWYPRRAWERWGYALREHDLLIQSGVLVHRRVSIPAGRIQHVDIHQGPFERLLGLARVQVFTASGGGADGVIPGLTPEVADSLRERLVRREADDVV